MSKSKHTPGPWTIDGSAGIIEHGDDMVCVVAWEAIRPSGYSSRADARLIAAAPDLLAACKVAKHEIARSLDVAKVNATRPWDVYRVADEVRVDGLRAIADQLRDAIEKARGEHE